MRTRRNVLALALAAIVAVSLAGCVQPPAHVIPTSEPSSKPVFASNAAALAAAKKAFEGYVSASDAIGNDGGQNPQRIAAWVTPSRLKAETKIFNSFSKTGNRLTGSSSLSNFKLQQVTELGGGKVAVNIYVCDDVSASRLVNSSGADVTPSSRQDVLPFQVSLTNGAPRSSRLLVDGSGPWSGSNFCS